MYEKEKIDEATHFLAQMGVIAKEARFFRYELSAFLAAARSSLQYALGEASTKPDGENWYAAQVSGRPVVKWFKDKRDITIHQQPVVPNTHVMISAPEIIHVADVLSVRLVNPQGVVVRETYAGPDPEPQGCSVSAATVEYRYTFPGWAGAEDVLTLAARYLVEINEIVVDGRAKGFLS